MKYAVDTSVLIDLLREHPPAVELFERLVEEEATLVSSYVIRTEVLSGMRRGEERDTRAMLDTIEWLPVGESESEAAGALDTPDLLLAEVAERQGAELLTTNIKHFRELLPGIRAPYRS